MGVAVQEGLMTTNVEHLTEYFDYDTVIIILKHT